MRLVYTVVLSIFITSCNDRASNNLDLSYLFQADPVSDAVDAINSKDFRFYGIYGYSAMVPEVNRRCIDLKKDVKMIKGTFDAIDSYKAEQFNALAEIYAFHYNIQMKMYLKDKGLFDCDEDNIPNKKGFPPYNVHY